MAIYIAGDGSILGVGKFEVGSVVARATGCSDGAETSDGRAEPTSDAKQKVQIL